MKLIKLLSFIFLISSCNDYLGTVEPDYIPKNEISEVQGSKLNFDNQTVLDSIESIIYPDIFNYYTKISPNKIERIISLEEDTFIHFFDENLYFSKKKSLFEVNLINSKIKNKFKLELDKDEVIINIFNNSDNLFILTNKLKLFSIEDNSIILKANFNKFISSNIIKVNTKIIVFSVFGEALEIDLLNYDINEKGKFIINHGLSISSNNYNYSNLITHLFNSGTLVFLDKNNHQLVDKYYLDDLNILSNLGVFSDFIDAPFEYKGFLYFIDKKGFISIYQPITSEILWEIDINTSIKDYNFTKDGNLIILTNTKILIFNNIGSLILNIEHDIQNPSKLLTDLDKFYILNKDGISINNININLGSNFLKNKFNGELEIFIFNSELFVKDSKNLFKISE